MEKVIASLVNFIIKNSDDEIKNQEILKYGLELLILKTFFVSILLIIGILSGNILESIVFTVSFSQIRSISGGYHAKSRLSCLIISVLLFIVAILLLKIQTQCKWLFWGIAGISFILSIFLFIVSPIDTENKRLDEAEYQFFRKKAHFSLAIEIIIACIFLLIGLKSMSFMILIGLIEAAFLVSLEFLKRCFSNEKV